MQQVSFDILNISTTGKHNAATKLCKTYYAYTYERGLFNILDQYAITNKNARNQRPYECHD